MSLETIMSSALYECAIADDAMYIDGSGQQTSVRVIKVSDDTESINGMDYNIMGAQLSYYLRKSSIANRPLAGDRLVIDGDTYCVSDAGRNYNATDWQVFVVPE